MTFVFSKDMCEGSLWLSLLITEAFSGPTGDLDLEQQQTTFG